MKKAKKNRIPGQPNIYRHDRLDVGQLGYYLPGDPKFWGHAGLEFGEEEFIYDAPRLVGGGTILNLGDLSGGSAILLAQGLRDRKLDGHVFTVDNYSAEMAEISRKNMKKAGVEKWITILNFSTDAAHKHFCQLPSKDIFDFIFIDAGHSYDDVKADWERFSPMLKEKGIISFHDTNQIDTNKVVEEISEDEWTMMFWVNRIKAFVRK
jgi:predicted O-methyltransferase YrrM